MNSSAASGSLIEQSASLPGSDDDSSAHRGDTLVDDLSRIGRIFLEELCDLLIDSLLDDTAYPRVAELGLRLPFELRVLQLHRDDAGETFAHILPIKRLVLLQQSLVAGVAVQRRG